MTSPSRNDSMDLDAAMDAIQIDDDLDFLSTSMTSSGSGAGVLVGNVDNPFDDGSSSDEGGDDDKEEGEVQGQGQGECRVKDGRVGSGYGAGRQANVSTPEHSKPVSNVDAITSSTISTINRYHDSINTNSNAYERTEEEQMEVESFVTKLGGWGEISKIPPTLNSPPPPDATLPQPPPSPPLPPNSLGLMSILFPSGKSSPKIGPPILRLETLEKKGTESVVKSTNKRDIVLTSECLVVGKSFRRGRENSVENDFEALTKSKTEGYGGGNDGGGIDVVMSPSEGRIDDRRLTGFEVKQFERLENVMLLDLTKTGMLRHDDDKERDCGVGGEDEVLEGDKFNDATADGSSSNATTPVKASRNPFKNWRRGRASMVAKSFIPSVLGGGRNASSAAGDISEGKGKKDKGKVDKGDIWRSMESLVAVDKNSSLGKSPELSFAVITPARTYIFISPNPTSHMCWVKILGEAIVKAHERRNSRLKVQNLPIGWRHLLSRTSVYSACLTSNLPMLHSTLLPSNVNKRDASGYTPLHYAAMKGDASCSTYLLDNGADPNALCMTSCRGPLFYACGGESVEVTRLLVANGADVKAKDVDGLTLAHVVTDKGENSHDAIGMLRLLTSAGTEINEGDGNGSTPLHLAASRGLPRMVKCLANVGAIATIRRTRDGLTPLQLSCARPFTNNDEELFNIETIRNLLGIGACPNLPVREDARVRGSVYEREHPDETRRVALDILICGVKNELLIEGNDEVVTVDEAWCYKVFVGIMELIRGGCRYSDELFGMLPDPMKDVFKQARQDWKDKKIPQDDLMKFSHHLYRPIDKSLWKDDSASSACMLCEDGFTPVNRRHHCRMCGILACGACTSKSMVIIGEGGEIPKEGGVGGFFANIAGSSGPKEERVCDVCFNKTISHLAELQEETADRGKLMARIDKEMHDADMREVEATRSELFSGADGGSGSKKSGSGGAHSVMTEAMDNMNKRGEKLDQLNDKSEAMKNAAAEFKDMAKTLKNHQQKKAARWGF